MCHQYWPDGNTKGVQKYGEYSVSVLQATEQDGFIERIISITNPKVVNGQEDVCTLACSDIFAEAIVLALFLHTSSCSLVRITK